MRKRLFLSIFAVSLVSWPGGTFAVSVCTPVIGADKCERWAAIYNGPGQYDVAGSFLGSRAMAASPDGKTVFVAGTSDRDPTAGYDFDFIVIAFDAATGAQRWFSQYQGSADLPRAIMYSLAVSPTGSSVVVTGTAETADVKTPAIATVAFAADSGAQLWNAIYREPLFNGLASDVTISPDGRRVYIAGYAYRRNPDSTTTEHGVVAAYDAANGERLWLDSFLSSTSDLAVSSKIAAAPDGSRVYVAASELIPPGDPSDVVLLVYNPVTGERLRTTHHPTKGLLPAGIVVSPDSSRVFIAEQNFDNPLRYNSLLTLAYDATGSELWAAQFGGTSTNNTHPWYYGPLAVSPDGSRVFLASLGSNNGGTGPFGFDTVSYDAATGEQKWTARFEDNVLDCACGPTVATNPVNGEVYITGLTFAVPFANRESTTIAYDPITGARNWLAIYRSERGSNESDAIAVSPYGDRMFVAGSIDSVLETLPASPNLLTLTYDTGILPSLRPISAHSRKTHAAAGDFDIYLPLGGNAGIECRTGGTSDGHRIIFNFATAVTYNTASVTPAANRTAELDGAPLSSGDGREVTVKLKNVSDAQTISVKLLGVSDGTNTNDVTVPMLVLAGDTNRDARVNVGDTNQTKSNSGSLTNTDNFRTDVNVDGRINVGDTNFVKAHAGASRPQRER